MIFSTIFYGFQINTGRKHVPIPIIEAPPLMLAFRSLYTIHSGNIQPIRSVCTLNDPFGKECFAQRLSIGMYHKIFLAAILIDDGQCDLLGALHRFWLIV